MARNEVWAIDIGEAALKAVKVRRVGSGVEALAFDVIAYEQVLSAPGVDADAQVRQALTTFVGRNVVKRERVVAAISARSALIRFIKLPPVEPKKIPDVVQYEASQHIPFPLEEVVWDHQAMRGGQVIDFEVEVGMFAMRREIVRNFLNNLLVTGLRVDKLQLAPMALYNFVYYDRRPKEALVVLDVGAANSTLLVVEGMSIWTRSLGIGGNDFTRALASKFNLPFPKAELLKRRAATSEKYAQQVFDALRTPARNLVDELQRSIGYYKSVHKEARLERILLLGSSFALAELARFVGVSLGLEVEVFQKPRNISIGAAAGLAKYREYATSYGVALGLAVEGLGLGVIDTNMLPKEIVKKKELSRKRPFAAVAAALILLSVLTAYGFAKGRLSSLTKGGQQGPKVLAELTKLEQDIKVTKDSSQGTKDDIYILYKAGGTRRDIWLDILDAITKSIPSKDPQSTILLAKLTSEVTEEEVTTAEEEVAEPEETRMLTEEERDAMVDYEAPLSRFAEVIVYDEEEWDEALNERQRNEARGVFREIEMLGYIRVLDWEAGPPKWEWNPGFGIEGAEPGVPGAPGGGVTPLGFVGVKKILHLKLTAERRALTRDFSAALDEIEADFVEPLRKHPFFVEVKLGRNTRRVTYVEDKQEGYRLGKVGTYKPQPGVETRSVDWIIFDVLITVDPTRGSLEAVASTAVVS